jgi:putative DNA base modification enzyme with NMAD domain
MQVVLLRVAIDKGFGGILGPLFKDGSFEYVPIPDKFNGCGISDQTYGNTKGKCSRKLLLQYFPKRLQQKRRDIRIHYDPEFETFTYGDPTAPKRGLRKLGKGDLLVFYAGLKGFDFSCNPALYIFAYFEVEKAGLAGKFSKQELKTVFGNNFHVRHRAVFAKDEARLVLVKGSRRSRLLTKAKCISAIGSDKRGRPLHVLSPEMQKIFGNFDGHTSIQRSPPRWVKEVFVAKASAFVTSLR